MTYDVVPGRPAGELVASARLADCGRLDPGARYDVTLDAYLAGGGFAASLERNKGINQRVGPKDLDALVRYVRQLPQPFRAGVDGRVRSVPDMQPRPQGRPIRRRHRALNEPGRPMTGRR